MHLLWYYVAPPVSGWPGYWHAVPLRRFHARQSVAFGMLALKWLLLALVAEVISGYIPRVGVSWVRSLVAPCAVFLLLLWVWLVASIAQRGHCVLPVLGPRAARKAAIDLTTLRKD